MENKFTPENIVNSFGKAVVEATPPVVEVSKALIVPLLRALTWSVDGLVAAHASPHSFARQVTRYAYAQTHKREESHIAS